jgi:hypothetical protein
MIGVKRSEKAFGKVASAERLLASAVAGPPQEAGDVGSERYWLLSSQFELRQARFGGRQGLRGQECARNAVKAV